MHVGLRTEGRVCVAVGESVPHAVATHPRVLDGGAGACVFLCACMLACAGVVTPRSAVEPTIMRTASESLLSRRSVLAYVFCWGCMSGWAVCASPSASRRLTLSPPRVFDVGAGVCVCLCACMLACVGVGTPRSTVASITARPACESPIAVRPVDFWFLLGGACRLER